MRAWIFLVVVLTGFLLSGCGKPVPPEKGSYVGRWESSVMALRISQDGRVVYKRSEGGVSKSLDGPLKGFTGDNFEAGIGPLASTFVVSAAPHQVDGKWKMTVDGVELTKVE
jgi:hypothetical protein